MKNLLCAVLLALALPCGSANANLVSARDPWVLVGLDFLNGLGLYGREDVASDAGVDNRRGSMPMFDTRGECLAAQRRVLAKYRNVGHADGGFGYYLCTRLSQWARPEFK